MVSDGRVLPAGYHDIMIEALPASALPHMHGYYVSIYICGSRLSRAPRQENERKREKESVLPDRRTYLMMRERTETESREPACT